MENEPVWERGGWGGLPQLEGAASADVCVVGLGGSGLTCALELRARGLSVVGVDGGAVAGGAAGRNGGFLLAGLAEFYHDAAAALGRARAAAIYRHTLAEMERVAATPEAGFRRVGSLRIAADAEEEADCAAQLEAMRADDLPAEAYEGPEGRGLLIPTDGGFQPLERCRALARRALVAGARLFERTPALTIGRGLVATPAGDVRCGAVVVAVDGGLERALPELAGRVRTARLQMLATAPADDVRVPRPVYFRWGYEYWQQLPGGEVALGGFRDVGGEGEWGAPPEPAEPVQGLMERLLRERVGTRAPVTHRWAAQVAFSDRALPFVGEARPGVWAAGAYSGTGNVVGALCGRALAERVASGRSGLFELLAG